MRRGAIAKCAESVGGMQAAVDMTVAYSKERVQYDRPIGAFQALQHIMADMWTAMQTSRYILYQAAWMESEGMPCTKEVAMAKAYINEKYKWVTERAYCYMAPSAPAGSTISRSTSEGLSQPTSVTAALTSRERLWLIR